MCSFSISLFSLFFNGKSKFNNDFLFLFLLLFRSSVLRKRQVDERKQKLSEKVDKIKKKMKESEGSNSLLGKTVIAGLVICAVMAGVAFFYYRYQ